MPARSTSGFDPTAPPYGINPLVVSRLTTPLREAGPLQEPPVCSQKAQVTRFAATATPEPELEPRGERSVS